MNTILRETLRGRRRSWELKGKEIQVAESIHTRCGVKWINKGWIVVEM
jgi:hypothetical protein